MSNLSRHHSHHFQAKLNHPTTYEDTAEFKGPLVLQKGITGTTSDNRCRIQKYYLDHQSQIIEIADAAIELDGEIEGKADMQINGRTSTSNRVEKKRIHQNLTIPIQQLKPLKGTECTDTILKTIVDHLAYCDAPVDVKEVAESMEFYLRTRKRLLGAAKKYHKRCININSRLSNDDGNDNGNGSDSTSNSIGLNAAEPQPPSSQLEPSELSVSEQKGVTVYDLCSGHGLTGMLFAACNPPTNDRVVRTVLVDQTEPPSFQILSSLIGQVCPWLNDCVEFQSKTLDEFAMDCTNTNLRTKAKSNNEAKIVIAIHACGSLTDQVLQTAVDLGACGIAAMPCCYTGTDKGTPYGVKRALGVSWAADIRRSFYLNDNKYHSDFSTIPREITPMNRIIVAEDRS